MRKGVGQSSGGSKGTDVSAPSLCTAETTCAGLDIGCVQVEPYEEQESWGKKPKSSTLLGLGGVGVSLLRSQPRVVDAGPAS